MAKILLIEDDADLAPLLARRLQKEGHLVEIIETGHDGLQMLNAYKYDIVIIDWSLPDTTGVEIVKKYRHGGGMTPIIFLTGKSDVESKKTGLDSGADDYLPKPFDAEELSARIRALLRRPAGVIRSSLQVENVRIEQETKTVFVDEKLVELGAKEYGILELLMRHPDRCFSSKELIESVWPSDTESNDDAVRSCVKKLRSKIASQDGACILGTVYGAGYTISPQRNNKK